MTQLRRGALSRPGRRRFLFASNCPSCPGIEPSAMKIRSRTSSSRAERESERKRRHYICPPCIRPLYSVQPDGASMEHRLKGWTPSWRNLRLLAKEGGEIQWGAAKIRYLPTRVLHSQLVGARLLKTSLAVQGAQNTGEIWNV